MEKLLYFQSGYMSDPPSVSRVGSPPCAGTVYNSHGPSGDAAWQNTNRLPSGLHRAKRCTPP